MEVMCCACDYHVLNLGQIVMEDVEIPEENLLPNVSGLKVKIECEVTSLV